MRVLKRDQDGGAFRQPLDQRNQRGDRPLSLFARGHFQGGVAALERDREQGREEWRDVPRLQSRTGDHRLQLVEPRGVRLAAGKTRRAPDLACDRKESVVDVVGEHW